MSPGNKSSRERLQTDPPFFHPDRDLQEWRRNIGRWVDLILAAAEKGNDRQFSTVSKILGRTLYERGLPAAQKSIVDEAQAKAQIDYRQEDQVQAVREIVDLIAVDPPIAGVSRLISSFNKVTSCERKNNEDLTLFVSRFRGLAADHLVQVNASSSSQIGEVLAITLLNNAKLGEGTLTNAKMSLISLAEERSKKEAEHETVPVLMKSISETSGAFADLKIAITSNDPNEISTDNPAPGSIFSKLDVLESKIGHLNESSIDRGRSVADMFASREKRTRLHLDDAVTVLNNLSVTPANNASGITMQQVESLFSRQLEAYFTRFQGVNQSQFDWSRVGNQGQASDGNGSDQITPKATQRKNRHSKGRSGHGKGRNNAHRGQSLLGKRSTIDKNSEEVFDPTLCKDCGEEGHERGDPECRRPSAFTKFLNKRRKGNNQGRPDREQDGSGDSFFRRSSQSGGN